MHFVIIIAVVVFIVYWQITTYIENDQKLETFKDIFPKNDNSLHLIKTGGLVSGINSEHKNEIFNTIINTLNKYLISNKGAISDYHLMKDIVDRNCDAAEDEIHTQIPVPLYFGLIGTMAGILIGILFLWISGGLHDLLNSGSGDTGAKGVQALLGGVALAMISSILGILLTTIGSSYTKTAKAEVEKDKNNFLSWIQAELLPNLSSNISSALVRMANNLKHFNTTFSNNTHELQETFGMVKDSYQDISTILTAINNMKIVNIAAANIEVYDKLKNCTEEIGTFYNYLQSVNEYVTHVKELNDKLDINETRTQAIEDMGAFFKTEVQQIDQRKSAISRTVGSIDATLQEALKILNENTESHLNEFTKSTVNHNQTFGKAIEFQKEIFNSALLQQQENFVKLLEEQQKTLHLKSNEIDKKFAELQNSAGFNSNINNLGKATSEQNTKIDMLTDAIKELTNVQKSEKQNQEAPKWLKLSIFSAGILISITCLAVLIPLVIEWITNLFK